MRTYTPTAPILAGMMAGVLLFVPFVLFAQSAALEETIQAAFEAEGVVIDEDTRVLIALLAGEAEAQGVEPEDVSQGEVFDAPEENIVFGPTENVIPQPTNEPVSIALLLALGIGALVAIGVLVALWRRMHLGGATGSAATGMPPQPTTPEVYTPPPQHEETRHE